MKLRLFRSIGASSRRCPISLTERLQSQQYDGLELTLPQLEAGSSALFDACAQRSLRLVCRLDPVDASEAGNLLERLSRQLRECGRSSSVLESVKLHAPSSITQDLHGTLSYLREVQPQGADFLEAFPTVGSSHGRLNAHGNQLPNHVFGICHVLPAGVPLLADVCGILTPTRLALCASANLIRGSGTGDGGGASGDHHMDGGSSSTSTSDEWSALPQLTDADGGLTDELESAVEATDVCYIGTDQASEACSPIWDEVWCTQQLEGASETYATCTTSAATSWDHPTGTQGEGPSPPTTDDETDDRAARELAQRLRRRFEESAKWRAGAGERRAAAAAAARSRRTFAANGMIGRAAASFGFDAEELNDSDSLLRKVKERWRELAKQEHPDVKGGNSDRFLELKASYQALLRVARSRGGE